MLLVLTDIQISFGSCSFEVPKFWSNPSLEGFTRVFLFLQKFLLIVAFSCTPRWFETNSKPFQTKRKYSNVILVHEYISGTPPLYQWPRAHLPPYFLWSECHVSAPKMKRPVTMAHWRNPLNAGTPIRLDMTTFDLASGKCYYWVRWSVLCTEQVLTAAN